MLQKLSRFINLAKPIVALKSTLPVLGCICVKDGLLQVTDLQHTLTMKTDDKRSYFFGFKNLQKVLKTKPQSLSVELTSDKTMLNYDSRTLSFDSEDIDSFPALPNEKFELLGSWDNDLVKVFHSQKAFVSTDMLKPALNHVHLEKNGMLNCVATDGHLLRKLSEIQNDGKDCTLDITPKLLGLLVALKRPVDLLQSENYLRFDCGEVSVYQRRSTDDYPDTDKVIPKDKKGVAIVNSTEIGRLVKDAAGFSHPKTKLGKLTFDKKVLQLITEDPDKGTSWEGSVTLKKQKGKKLTIGFNLDYLKRLLAGVDSMEIMMGYSTPVSAVVVSPVERNGYGTLGLIMPIRLEDKHE
jgi:DNA polymerase-3 subunit beta|tara:strand:+ start:70 stop:1128 length:1059 start_codon:yes stop_codon:yes gene_type:complete